MAKLPDPYLGERPSLRPVTGISRYRSEQGDEAVGHGIAQMGEDLDQAGTAIYRADQIRLHQQKIEQRRVDTLRAEDAFTQLRDKQNDLTLGQANGFTNVKGSEAVSRQVLPEWDKKFEDAQSGIATSLGNDTQREMFQKRASIAKIQYNDDILRHLAHQREVYGKEVFDGILGSEERSAAGKWNSPNDVAMSLTRIDNAVHDRAESQGWPAEYSNAIMLEAKGKIHSAVINQALANQDFVYAENWFNKNKEQIDSHTASQLSKAVEGGQQRQTMADFTRDFITNQMNYPALPLLMNKVLADPVLDDTRKNTLMGRIQNQMLTLERRAEVEKNRREKVIGTAINEINGNTMAGYEPNLEQMEPILHAAQGTEMEQEAQRMVELAKATRQFRSLPPLQQAQQITAAELELRKDPTKFDRRVLDAWKSIQSAQQEQVQKDPTTFAVRQGYADPAPLNLSDPGKVAGDLATRYSLARSVSKTYQAPFKPLTEPEAKLVTSALSQASWQEKRDYMAKLYAASAGDNEGYSAIMSQIAPDDPVTAIAGEYAGKGRAQASELMLRGEAMLRPNRKEDGKPDQGKIFPMPDEGKMRKAFDDSVRDAFTLNPEERNAIYQSTRSIYAALSSDVGPGDTKEFDDKRWEQALKLSTGGIGTYRNARIVLPYGMDIGTFKDQMDARLSEVSANLPGWSASRLRNLPVSSVGDGKYVLRSGDKYLPFVIDFNKPLPAVVAPRTDAPAIDDYGRTSDAVPAKKEEPSFSNDKGNIVDQIPGQIPEPVRTQSVPKPEPAAHVKAVSLDAAVKAVPIATHDLPKREFEKLRMEITHFSAIAKSSKRPEGERDNAIKEMVTRMLRIGVNRETIERAIRKPLEALGL